MIKNNLQLTMTKKKIEMFNETIEKMAHEKSEVHPILRQAQIDAISSQRDKMIKEAEDYELLLSGQFAVFDVASLSDLPKALIMSRISMGLTQKDLAERLGMKEQQIQRYENTEYSSASFSTLLSIVEALDLKITEDVFLPKESRQKNILLEKLKDAGLEKSFIEKRIAPREVSPFELSSWVSKTVDRISEIFGWSKELLLSDAPLVIGRDASMVARFKMPVGANQQFVSAYTQYAFCLASIISRNFKVDAKPLSSDPELVRSTLLKESGKVDFKSVLSFATNHGIPVIPLNDSGAFHGATWRINGKNVIVLKQRTAHISKWTFDLLHELYHASQRPDLKEFSVIELSETSEERRTDQEEVDANDFAAKVLLGSSAADFVQECLHEAQGKIAWLKNAVIQVAEKHGLDCGVLAYQVANKVEQISRNQPTKLNWWGAANNLQENPYSAKDVCIFNLLENVNVEKLEDTERELVEQAITN